MLVEDETNNNSADNEMKNEYRTEKGDDDKKIRKGIRFFY